MTTQKLWTAREIMELRLMHADGMRAPEMARELCRSAPAVRHKCQELNLQLKLGGSMEDKMMPDPTDASRKLGEAINALILKMPANDVAEMLGKPHLKIPGTERIYKTAAVQRLAA